MAELQFRSAETPPTEYGEELLLAVFYDGDNGEVVRGKWTKCGWWTYSDIDLSVHLVMHWAYFDDAVNATRKEVQ